jgi:hypothetical protein
VSDMAGAKIIAHGPFVEPEPPWFWVVEYGDQRFGVRTRFDGEAPGIADLYEIFVDEDGREVGTAEIWEVTVGGEADKIAAAAQAVITQAIRDHEVVLTDS